MLLLHVKIYGLAKNLHIHNNYAFDTRLSPNIWEGGKIEKYLKKLRNKSLKVA